MDDLRVTLVQGDTRWHDPAGNRDYYAGLIAPIAGQTDLVVLPETFTSGFSNEAVDSAEHMDGPAITWLAAQARGLDAVVTGSVVIREQGKVFNRLVWMRPDGRFDIYDKRHLFRMANEHERYAGGDRRLLVELKGWRVFPQVCYDLRFPVWLRNRYDEDRQRFDYDLMLFVANWPSPRRGPWRTLLRARAIENLAYCVGVNRVGCDGNGLGYGGDSAAIDMVGEPLIELGAQAQIATVVLDAGKLAAHRERFPAWRDADDFQLN
jgi:predicted amidohydrolase